MAHGCRAASVIQPALDKISEGLGGYGSPLKAYSAWLSRSPHWYGEGGIFTDDHRRRREARPEAVAPLRRGGTGDVHFHFPNHVGSRQELIAIMRQAMEQFCRQNGRPAFGT
jgi:hypothetical protein